MSEQKAILAGGCFWCTEAVFLDVAGVEWLEAWFRDFRGAAIIVSHDRSFLDAVTTRLRSDEETGAAALLRHIRLFPRDALAVSVAVPGATARTTPTLSTAATPGALDA